MPVEVVAFPYVANACLRIINLSLLFFGAFFIYVRQLRSVKDKRSRAISVIAWLISSNIVVANSDAEYPKTDDEAEDYILTALEQRIRANNVLVANKMVQKSKKKAVLFADGTLVTLAIPSKMRLSLEPKRMLCRIIKCVRGLYTLTFKFGRIKGAWTASQLNGIQDLESGVEIPLYWPDNGPTIALTQAVQLSNYRGTVASMHKPNRDAAAQRTKALAVAAKALEVVASLAPPGDKPANQLAQELAQEVSPEPVPEVAIALGSGLGRELGTQKRKRTAKAVVPATPSAPARSLRSSGRKRQRR
jgi:hypothetical protein